MAEAVWDGRNRKIEGASRTGMRCDRNASRQEPQQQEPKGTTKTQTTHPNPYVPLRVFGCLGAVFAAGECCNPMHFVTNCCTCLGGLPKLLQTVHKLLQLVATAEKREFGVPTRLAIPFLGEGANQATSMDSTPQPRRRKTRSDLVHLRSLPSVQPATKMGQVTWAWGEIEAGLGGGMKLKEVWEAASRDGLEMSVPAISRLCLTATTTAPATFRAPEQPPPQTSDGERGATSSAASRSIQKSAGAAGKKETIGIRIRSVLN